MGAGLSPPNAGELVDRLPGPLKGKERLSHPVRALVAGGLVLAVTMGEIATAASPWARWRRPWPIVGELVQVHPQAQNKDTLSARKQICADALDRDADAQQWIPALRRIR